MEPGARGQVGDGHNVPGTVEGEKHEGGEG